MKTKPMTMLLAMLAGWINRQQQEAIEYLKEENKILRGELLKATGKKRIILNDSQRRRLAILGKKLYSSQRIEDVGYIFASPVGGGDRVYITDRRGTTIVIKHGETYEVLARNQLDDSFSASPTIVGREIYLRGHQNLYCIAKE